MRPSSERRKAVPEKKNPKRRTQVKDLPKREKELSKREQKKVKGGVLEDPYILIASKSPNPIKTR